VQIYVSDVVASMIRPVRQLAGFCRVSLDPGASARVEFDFDTSQLAFLDTADRIMVEAGEIVVRAGTSASDLPLEDRFDVVGSQELSHRHAFVTPSRVTTSG
jgi:beta-glucosidase